MKRWAEIERLAEISHTAWAEAKRKQGFHHPDECPNKASAGKINLKFFGKYYCKKCHDGLCSYTELSEDYKDLDRATMKAVILAYTKSQDCDDHIIIDERTGCIIIDEGNTE